MHREVRTSARIDDPVILREYVPERTGEHLDLRSVFRVRRCINGPAQLIRLRLLQRNGWSIVRIRGSHRQLRHESRPGVLTVAGKLGV